MSIDLKMLVWSTALAFVQTVLSVLGAMQQVGLPRLAGNRDPALHLEGWAGRADRAHQNMMVGLVLFAALVLTAQVAGRANAATALGAQMFFWARLAYAILYVAGIPWLRTAAWAVSVVGLITIFLQLL